MSMDKMNIMNRIQWWIDHPPYFITHPEMQFRMSRRSGKTQTFIYQMGEKLQRATLAENKPCFIRLAKEDFEEFLSLYPGTLEQESVFDEEDELGYVHYYRDFSLRDGTEKAPLVAQCFEDTSECKCKCGCDDKSWYEVCSNWKDCYESV